MNLDASRRAVPELVLLDSVASTNAELVARAIHAQPSGGLEDYTALVTFDQTAGRGRLDRSWTAPAGASLASSVVVRPVDAVGRPVPVDRLGWLSIAAGVAMTEAVTEAVPAASVSLKWPNDVLIGDRKVCGVLSEAVAGDAASPVAAVVIGAGLNLTMTTEQLPVPTATSLVLEGAEPVDLADRMLSGYLTRLRSHVAALLAAGGNADHSGLRERARELCGTLGGQVRVELPGDEELRGTAVDLDALGRLIVATPAGPVAVAAGDVTHLRHA